MKALVTLDGNEVEIIVTRIIQGRKCHIVGHLPGSDTKINITLDKLVEFRCSEDREYVDRLLEGHFTKLSIIFVVVVAVVFFASILF